MESNLFEEIDSRLSSIEQLLNKLFAQQRVQPSIYIDDIDGMELTQQIIGRKRTTIYCYVHHDKIPHFKRRGKLYLSKQALIDWITAEGRDTAFKQEVPQLPERLSPRHRKSKLQFNTKGGGYG